MLSPMKRTRVSKKTRNEEVRLLSRKIALEGCVLPPWDILVDYRRVKVRLHSKHVYLGRDL